MKTKIRNLFLLPALMLGIELVAVGGVKAEGLTTIFTTLHSFTPPSWDPSSGVYINDGANPVGGLITNSSGNILYGTTFFGGNSDAGTVFAVNIDGKGLTNLYRFSATGIDSSGYYATNGDGASPRGSLLLSGDTLYGIATVGGNAGAGTVFAVNIDGTRFTNLHSFTATSTNSSGVHTNGDGAFPYAGLTLSGNTLYGTANQGGSSGAGTVFAINTDGTGFTNLHSFAAAGYDSFGAYTNDDGANPYAELILSGSTIYGTTDQGGTSGGGTVFAMKIDGADFTNLHNFLSDRYNFSGGYTNDGGAYPQAPLILSGEILYGTTYRGGNVGYGTVFAINTDGTGFTNLHSFAGYDGSYPVAGLTLSSNGLFGTAYFGGSLGNGTVFVVNTDGTGFTTLHNFTRGDDGANPSAQLLLSGNTLYGTAIHGGGSAMGTVFSLLVRPPITLTVTSISDSGPGTLRDALASAASGDTIDATGVSGVILLTSGRLLVTSGVTIVGPGPANLAVDGNAAGQLFYIAPLNFVTIASLTITNGQGGIYNDHATLRLSNCTVSGNSGLFGGIYNNGSVGGRASLQIVNSTLSSNSASYGGAIYNDASSAGSAYLRIDSSTLNGNSADRGGGIYSIVASVFVNFCYPRNPPCNRYGDATVSIVNSTLSGNWASFGGGIYNGFNSGNSPPGSRTSLSILNSTLSGNSALYGGGIYIDASDSTTVQLASTILNAGASGGNISVNSGGGFDNLHFSGGYNLSTDSGNGALTGLTDQINTDPMLGPLEDNGGPTLTHALLPGSPAIDQGRNYSGSTDQRGFERTVDFNIANSAGGDGTDIGAVEMPAVLRFSNYRVVSNQVGFDVLGLLNQVVIVDVSTNLLNWTPLTTNTLGASPFCFTDAMGLNSPQRFYRARVQ